MHWERRFNHMVKRYNEIYRVQLPGRDRDYYLIFRNTI